MHWMKPKSRIDLRNYKRGIARRTRQVMLVGRLDADSWQIGPGRPDTYRSGIKVRQRVANCRWIVLRFYERIYSSSYLTAWGAAPVSIGT